MLRISWYPMDELHWGFTYFALFSASGGRRKKYVESWLTSISLRKGVSMNSHNVADII